MFVAWDFQKNEDTSKGKFGVLLVILEVPAYQLVTKYMLKCKHTNWKEHSTALQMVTTKNSSEKHSEPEYYQK